MAEPRYKQQVSRYALTAVLLQRLPLSRRGTRWIVALDNRKVRAVSDLRLAGGEHPASFGGPRTSKR